MIVGEAPGKYEVERGVPFIGASGDLLDDLLSAVGFTRGQAFVTNVLRERAPGGDAEEFFAKTMKARTSDHQLVLGQYPDSRIRFGRDLLLKEIALCRPTTVLALGNVAMWALTGNWGIQAWRGSELQGEVDGHRFQVIPTYHPAAVFREQSVKRLIHVDFARARAKFGTGEVQLPPWNFLVRPTFDQVLDTLGDILLKLEQSNSPIKLAGDIETRGGHIACMGLAWSKFDAICVPFMCVERTKGYWTLEEEAAIVQLFRAILTHPRAHIIGQNWNYDRQYFHRWWFFTANLGSDTMVKHHSMYSISRKGLGFLSSLYCQFHRYWKDDGRLWDPSMDEEKFWRYNCEDCVRTFEVDESEDYALAHEGRTWPKLPEVVAFQHRIHAPVFKMMVRGFRHDALARAKMGMELGSRCEEIQKEINRIAGQELNVRSSPGMQDFFYRRLNQTPIRKRKPDGTWGPTCDDDALGQLADREPILRPLVARIRAMRSAETYISNYIKMRLDTDGRIRCSFGVAATKTYRFNSDENAFGSGRNLQNVPSGDEAEDQLIPLPNIRKIFVPDPGMTIFDIDGDSADLRIVTGESGCRAMQSYFAAGAKPYIEIGKEYYRDPTISKKDSRYKLLKALCHGTNYGGTPPGLASRIGLLVHEVERIQKWYFGMCPEIKAWQDDIRKQIHGRGWIENPFGYRLYFWDRITKDAENEALAWTPQSSVGRIINQAIAQIDEQLPWAELLLQVHDSATGQYPRHLGGRAQRELLEVAKVEVNCRSGRIIIPMGLKTSDISWGDCE